MPRSLNLTFISMYANELRKTAECIERQTYDIADAPPFETRAEDDLKRARAELESALLVVRRALANIEAARPQQLEAAE